MKTKDKKELYSKTIEELKNILKITKEEIFKLKLENFQKKLKNTSSISVKRKDLAKILTILRGKELEVETMNKSQALKK